MLTQEKINFPTTSSNDWANVAAQELNDSDAFAKLSKNINGVSVKPYYDAKDVPQKKNKKAKSEFKPWLNVPKISVYNAKAANKAALDHLVSGADGILFDLRTKVLAEDLLNKIELPHCHVFFQCNEKSPDFLDSLKTFVARKKWKETNGGFYSRNDFNSSIPLAENFFLGFEIKENENGIEQISDALRLAVAQIDSLTNSGVSVDRALASVAFLWPVRNNFFLSVAEMRAMRMVWALLAEAYGITSSLFLHAFSSAWANEGFQPHGNLIKQTTSGLAAVLGNCNALTYEAENDDIAMLTRTARNISSIMKEESHLDKVIDPVDGSYFIEQISFELAKNAWEKFQESV